ncbi:unnamed protein product [Vitrella brassicaformis CCMP3155]|uniref:Uncharacterized protein n=1 Tax=Vitrella brassicaformis (strain CCMP3155) TaxID=1169540 RepID=A0A0G4H5B0_VITBC|nr:unnamed protein product [Vitrella brassicaformis CCMP3155]|eukprot:CEM38976.1 unnamed protein product [Vitrella brassicaformis CCMP3155]
MASLLLVNRGLRSSLSVGASRSRHGPRLSCVNRETHEKATDETYGVFRHFTMLDADQEAYWDIDDFRELHHMGKIQVAHVEVHAVPDVVSPLLEACATTLVKLTLDSNTGPTAIQQTPAAPPA